ncbi:ATP-binding protein [Paracoccus sp. p3-h83]|uniref:ATP-binding protein n=1 Tax=Paracoccus sp. p3-h83 TaxID=3342805 RepID=UPI0035B72AEE
MRNLRLDSRLYLLLALLAALVMIVGGLAVGVNHLLIRGHQAMLNDALPFAERSGALEAASSRAAWAATGIEHAADPAGLTRAAGDMAAALDQLEAAYAGLAGAGSGADFAALRADLAALTRAAQDDITQTGALDRASRDLDRPLSALDDLLAAQTELARVRLTAGIADLHAGAMPDPRRGLDDLADDALFAFERTIETARAAEVMRHSARAVMAAPDAAAIDTARAHFAEALDQAVMRLDYLPTAPARAEAGAALAALGAALNGDGLFQHRLDGLAAGAVRDRALARLRGDIAQVQIAVRDVEIAAQQGQLARLAQAARQSQRLFWGMLAAVAAALAAVVALVIYARARLVARLGHVAARLVTVAQGDLGQPLPISGADAIGGIEQALNALRLRAAEAQALRGQLEQAVETRTRELVQEMAATEAARAQAEAAARDQAIFTARMSHEIRTPLNGLIGMLALIEPASEAEGERLRLARGAADDLLQIANDILALTAPDGASSPAPVHFRLRDLIAQVQAPMAALAAQKRLHLDVDLADGAPEVVQGDAVRIRQVLTNLLSNAVKYTDAGRVALLVDHAPGPDGQPVLSFAVTDTGRGMNPDQAARAFQDFSRADWTRRAGIEGSGLGLAIARRLTEAMGGALDLHTAPGVGTRVTLTVPLAIGDPARMSAPDDPAPTARHGLHVLVVEDHPVNRLVVRAFLDRLGCRVTEAEDAAGALRVDATVDLALVDLDLPDRPGQTVIADLRARQPDLPVAALTAHSLADDAATRARLGVVAVLQKPVSPRALADLLAGLAPDAPDGVAATLARDRDQIGTETVAALIAAFLDDLPGAVAAILSAEGQARGRAAHRLKGAASNFGLSDLCDHLARIEAEPAALDDTALRQSADTTRAALRAAARGQGIALPDEGSETSR